ncbi:MAG: bifunctional riboflavin kinase/FAD synthetase [Anaerolineales bacterium]
MRITTSLDCLEPEQRIALTIGSFDGLHIGHQHLIRQLVTQAHEHGWLAGALTFDPHPRKVLSPERRTALLSTPQERDTIFAALGLDVLIVLPFTREMADTSASAFVRELARCLHLVELWVGEGFALGKDRTGDSAALQRLADELGFRLNVVPPVMVDGQPVSSTRIRALVEAGRMREAAVLLGREYSLNSVVVPGVQRGRTLGFRTANLRIAAERAMPPNGVYAVRVQLGDECLPGVANLGIRPSFDAGEVLLEVHLLGVERDLYGLDLRVFFVQYLRGEMVFADAEELKAQIQRDIVQAAAILGVEVPARGV